MKIYKYLKPYDKKGKCTFKSGWTRSGVYLIKENNKIVYIGQSSYNIYKTMYRHFEYWHHKTQEVISYQSRLHSKKYTVRIVYCTAKQAQALEKALILKYNPRDNTAKYALYTTPREKIYSQQVIEKYENTDITNEIPF